MTLSLRPTSVFHPRQYHREDLKREQEKGLEAPAPNPNTAVPILSCSRHPSRVTGAGSLGQSTENQWRALQTGKHEY